MGPASWIGNGSGSDGAKGTGVEADSSNGCGGGTLLEDSSSVLMISATISVPAEKAGGDSVHPIGKRVGTAMRGGSSAAFGKGVASFIAPLGVRCN